MLEGTIGVGIISFDRPQYVASLLKSLEAQTHLQAVDFHFFQDGGVNKFSGRKCAEWADLAACVDLFARAELPTAFYHVQEENLGCCIHQVGAIEEMVARYDHVVILQDDVVLSPHYLRLVRVLFEQLGPLDDVASFNLGFKKLCPKHKVEENLDKIVEGCGHWWAEAFWARTWARMRPHFMEYFRLVEGKEYQAFPVREILALFRRKGWPGVSPGRDSANDMAIYAAGMRRVRTVVNRAISVGEHGVNFTPALFRFMGLDKQEPFVFEGDKTLLKFEWRK